MPLILDVPPPRVVQVAFSQESSFAAEARVSHVFGPVRLGAELTLPVFALDAGGRLEGFVEDRWVWRGPWGVAWEAGAYGVLSNDAVARAWGLGWEATAVPGYSTERWAVGAELGMRHVPMTYVQHKGPSQDAWNQAGDIGTPQDGWVWLNVMRWEAGVAVQWRAWESWVFGVRGGAVLRRGTSNFADIGALPFYVSVEGAWSF